MPYVFAGLVVLFLLALAVGALTRRVSTTSCCAPGDPRLDLRMRGAFDDEERHSRG